MRNKIILWLVLLLVGFLGGFMPQFAKARRLESDSQEAQHKLSVCEQSVRFSQFRDLAAMIYLETARRNYGLAAETASRFFSSLSEYTGQVADPQLKKRLEESLSLRDSITAGLAKGEPAVLSELETLLLQTHQRARP